MKSFFRILGWSALALVLLVVGGYLTRGVHGTVKVARDKDQARADVADGLPGARRRAAAARADLLEQLPQRRFPEYSWTELRCTFGTDDAGWIVQEYLQVCEVRTTDLVAVEAGTPGTGLQECPDVADLSDTGPGDATGRAVRGTREALSAPTGERDWSCPGQLVEGADRYGSSRVLEGARPASLSSSPAWVVATTSTPVSETEIGCSPWGVIFCSQPYAEPALPTADAD